MTRWHEGTGTGKGSEERPLQALDPERAAPGYWARLHRRIAAAAAPELARRRALRDVTLDEVIFSWARTVVPTALLAAAVAGLLLLQEPTPEPVAAAQDLEEALLEGLEGSGFPAVASGRERGPDPVMFAVESF